MKITIEEFKKLVNDYKEYLEELEKYSDLKIDLYDTKLASFAESMLDRYLKLIFNKDGVEWFYWWIFEKPQTGDEQAWDINGDVIPTETVEDLYNLLQKYYNE